MSGHQSISRQVRLANALQTGDLKNPNASMNKAGEAIDGSGTTLPPLTDLGDDTDEPTDNIDEFTPGGIEPTSLIAFFHQSHNAIGLSATEIAERIALGRRGGRECKKPLRLYYCRLMPGMDGLLPDILNPAYEPPEKCHLRTMPIEVLTAIMEYVLISDEARGPLAFHYNAQFPKDFSHRLPRSERDYLHQRLALAQTCKEFYGIALVTYYRFNTFVFQDIYTMENYLERLSSERRDLIQDVTFTYHFNYPHLGAKPTAALKLLGSCASLSNLTIYVKVNNIRSSTFRMDGGYEDILRAPGMRQLRRIRGCKEVMLMEIRQTPVSVSGINNNPSYHFDTDHVVEVEALLNEELCQPRKAVRAKKTSAKTEGNGNGKGNGNGQGKVMTRAMAGANNQ